MLGKWFKSHFVWLIGYMILIGCMSTPNTWVGSADAVFRYRAKDKSTIVYEVRPQSASETAGLKRGDRVLAVDGEDVTNASHEAVRDAIRGPVGSNVLLTIKRGTEVLELQVERRPIRKLTPTTEENDDKPSD